MNTRLTKIKDTEILSAVPETGHVMAEVDGVVKRVPGNKVGGVPTGAKAHQYLAADKNGNPQWRDQLAYKYDKPQTQYIDADGDTVILCKVSDEIPEAPGQDVWYTIIYDGAQQGATGLTFESEDGYGLLENMMVVVKKSGVELPGHDGVVFPETGIYMQKIVGLWHTEQVSWDGFSIAWDGVTEEVKTMPANGLAANPAPYQQLVTDGDGKTVWEDRLGYTYEGYLMQDAVLAFEDFNGMYVHMTHMGFDLKEGNKYKLIVDGEQHEYVARSIDVGGNTFIAIGNMSFVGDNSNSDSYGVYSGSGQTMMLAYVEGASHTVTVLGEAIAKIPKGYLPETVLFMNKGFMGWTADDCKNAYDAYSDGKNVMVFATDGWIKLLYCTYGVEAGYQFCYMGAGSVRRVSGDPDNGGLEETYCPLTFT